MQKIRATIINPPASFRSIKILLGVKSKGCGDYPNRRRETVASLILAAGPLPQQIQEIWVHWITHEDFIPP
jgi:hypothetical protein